MNILLTSYHFKPSIGGIQALSELLAEEFCKRGNSVRIVTQTKAAQDVSANDAAYKVLRQPSWKELIAAYPVFKSELYFEELKTDPYERSVLDIVVQVEEYACNEKRKINNNSFII
jgi:hypothetical protein